jgi:hypothetical protein
MTDQFNAKKLLRKVWARADVGTLRSRSAVRRHVGLHGAGVDGCVRAHALRELLRFSRLTRPAGLTGLGCGADGGGTLDKDELKLVIQQMGQKDPDMDAIMKEIDTDGGGDVDRKEFEVWWVVRPAAAVAIARTDLPCTAGSSSRSSPAWKSWARWRTRTPPSRQPSRSSTPTRPP